MNRTASYNLQVLSVSFVGVKHTLKFHIHQINNKKLQYTNLFILFKISHLLCDVRATRCALFTLEFIFNQFSLSILTARFIKSENASLRNRWRIHTQFNIWEEEKERKKIKLRIKITCREENDKNIPAVSRFTSTCSVDVKCGCRL